MPYGTGIEEGKYNVRPKTMLVTASCRLLGTHCLSPYGPDLEPRNFHFCRLRFYFLPAHYQRVVCSGTSISAGLLMHIVLSGYIAQQQI